MVWEKFRKLNGSNKPRIVPPLHRGGNIITSPYEIADTFADNYANILKYLQKKSKSGKNRNKNKKDELSCNKPFTDRELKSAINQQRNAAKREDVKKKLPPETLKY